MESAAKTPCRTGKTKDLRAMAAATGAETPEPGRWRRALASVEDLLREGKPVGGDLVLLQDYARLQRKLWDTRAGRLESQISQMKKESKIEKRVEAARLNLLLGLEKQLAAQSYKEKLDEESRAEDVKTLQATVAERDATIAELNADIKRRRKEAKVTKKEILRLRREVEILRASAKEKDETIALLQLEAETGSRSQRRGGEKKPVGSAKEPTAGGGGSSPTKSRASPASPEPPNHHGRVDATGERSQATTKKKVVATAGRSVSRASGRMTKLESCSVVKSKRLPKVSVAAAGVLRPSLFSANFKAPKLKTTSSSSVL